MLHPSESRLARFADDALSPERRARVAAHLAECARCREVVAEFRALNGALASLPVRPVPASILAGAVERRARGERVLVAGPARRTSWRALAARAAMVLVVLLGAGLALVPRTGDLTAAASDLRISPAAPRRGDEIRVAYRPGSALAREPELVLRGRLRTRDGAAYNGEARQTVLARLRRDAQGVFRGAFTLPGSVVYATLAVENRSASEVDTNLRAGWAVPVHAADGRPLPDALLQRMHDHMGRSWETAHETSIRMTELYPDSPRGWRMAAWYAGQLGADRDSVARWHRARLAAVEARADTSSADDVAALAYAWRELGDTARARHWWSRLAARAPAHPAAVHARVDDLYARHTRKELPRDALYQELERTWPATHDAPLDLALAFLSRTDSAARILRWVDRARERHPARDGAETLLRFPALRDEGLRRLRARIAHQRALPDEERGLFQTREQFRASMGAEIRAGYAELGTALVEGGNRRGGLDTLALAVAGGWEPRTFRAVAGLRLAAGDTAGALPLLARVAADPATPPAFADSALRRLGGTVDADRWRAALGAAAEEMQRGVLAGSVSRALPVGIRLTAADGTARDLREIASGGPAVVVFWSRSCGPALVALPEITRTARRLAERNVRLVLVTEELPSAAFRDFWRSHPDAPPVWHDTRREARRALGSFGTPQYFVLDASGRLRFELTTLEAIPRQLAALD